MKSGNLNFLESSGPLQACNGTVLPSPYLFYYELSGLNKPHVSPTVFMDKFLLESEVVAPLVKFPVISESRNCITSVQRKTMPLNPRLQHLNPVHIFTYCFKDPHYHYPTSNLCLRLPFRFSNEICAFISRFFFYNFKSRHPRCVFLY